MICLMFLTIMCLATQKNILCKLLKLYHQQHQEEEGVSRVWHLISHSLGPHPWIHLLLRLLSPLCHRLCLLSNVNGVAFACPVPPSCDLLPSCHRLVVLSTCEQLSGGYQFGPFVARLLPKVAWLIYVLLACFLCCFLLLLLVRLLLAPSWVFYYANDKIFINVININFGNNSWLRKIMRNDRGDKRLGALPPSTFRQCQEHSGISPPKLASQS